MPPEFDEAAGASESGLLRVRPLEAPSATTRAAAASVGAAEGSSYGAGELIADKYRLGRKLGQGGMGEVWLAHNQTLDIDVAIKLIRHEVASAEMTDRLLHEARAAARLGHPAIVRVNDFGKTARGDPFIVMELLDGEDLASALSKRGRLSAIKAVRTLLPIAHALTVAHTKGIVHRDLKPENIFLAKTDDGQIQPKLVDFGVAKLENNHSVRLTKNGALLGSPLYMSPEQARGDDVDHRADMWALAVVLYETVTGRSPFEGKNYNAVLYSIIANPPSPITSLDAGDADLWSIIERGLQKDPDRRWYSMRDFGESLARWLEEREVREDITGSSLHATWLEWHKSNNDVLSPGASVAPTPQGEVELPPLPRLESVRARQITLRQKKASTLPLGLGGLVGLGAGIVAVIVLAWFGLGGAHGDRLTLIPSASPPVAASPPVGAPATVTPASAMMTPPIPEASANTDVASDKRPTSDTNRRRAATKTKAAPVGGSPERPPARAHTLKNPFD